MSKPVRLYPKPEPIAINPKLVYLGSGLSGVFFFVVGLTFQNIGVFA